MTILFSRVTCLHLLLALVRLSLVFIFLLTCTCGLHAASFLHNVHSLSIGSGVGGMFASEVIAKETFADTSAKQNEEAALEDLQERKDKRNWFNEAWIGEVVEYYIV